MLREFAGWIEATPLSIFFKETSWIIPTSQSVHIIAVSLVFSSALLIDLRLLGVGVSGRSVVELLNLLVPWIWRGLGVLLATGVVQTIAEPQRQFVTPVFWAKMGMIVVVSSLTALYAKSARRQVTRRGEPLGRARSRLFAIVSLLLWLAIITCGRFIGYTWSIYV